MAARRLFVSPLDEDWIVQWEGGDAQSTHRTQAEAIAGARSLCGRSGDGDCSQIIVQGANGQFRTEWTYGTDAYPPRG